MHYSESGSMARKLWLEIPEHFPFVQLSEFVIMPNHVHGILILTHAKSNVDDNVVSVETRHALSLQQREQHADPLIKPAITKTPGQERFQNQGRNTVSSITGGYKSAVTRHARRLGFEFQWQERFWDHVIHDNNEFRRIKKYIMDNPANWHDDVFF
jgi:REP element-mobilizing transposase RayT